MSDPTLPRPICFVVSPIGDEGTKVRQRANVVLKMIKRVVGEFGFEAIRADEIAVSGLITTQVVRLLFEAPLVIADLTGANANVYYELALRHAVEKPYIQMIARGEKPRFDVIGLRTLEFDHSDIYSAEEELKRYMKALERPDFKVETPITVAGLAHVTVATR